MQLSKCPGAMPGEASGRRVCEGPYVVCKHPRRTVILSSKVGDAAEQFDKCTNANKAWGAQEPPFEYLRQF
ncbi:hypothetical protein T265_10073 [Opisthorchis viverrini]|uniref:Uncharacterized protein n=1 Tax=Opisthorchis viverrini TaxID=6198 RepID=A0A074Z3Q6_OPIVI|nr:hypothetical protein T265_10073 [Opisthorchis viverrini]KER21653.1 hypothetical protein T265_10073 [Opisthorchis viverrini]